MKRIAALLGIVAVLAVGFIFLSNRQSAEGPAQGGVTQVSAANRESAPKSAPVAVVAEIVGARDLRQILEVTGSLRTDDDVQIGSRLAGKVVAVSAREGDRVQAGQVLVRLDDRELQAEFARARSILRNNEAKLSLARNQATWKDTSSRTEHQRALAAVEAAKSRIQQAETNARLIAKETQTAVDTAQSGVKQAADNLAIVKDRTRKQDLRQAQLAVEQAAAEADQAKVDMDNARQVFERRRTLYQQDAIAKEEVDEAERRYKGAQSALTMSQATVESAKERLSLAQEGSRPEEVKIAEGQYARAERALRLAQSETRRNEVAQNEVAAAKAALEQAQAMVDATRAGLVQSKISQDEIANARAAIVQAQADIQFYQTQLADLAVRAPVSGIVASRQVNVGEMITPTTPLLNLVALDSVYFEARVPELDVGMLRPGLETEVRIDAVPGRRFSGRIREIIPVAEGSSRSFRVRIAVAGGGKLPAGAYARARVNVGTRQETLAVHREAIHSEAGDQFVWLIDSGKEGGLEVKRQTVKVGLSDGDYVEVLDGLQPGQRIVGPGSPVVVEGAAVTAQGT